MVPLYVKSLCSLLKTLGWSRRAIAEQLGVSGTLVSLWAHGHRPVGRQYRGVFLDLVDAAICAELPGKLARRGRTAVMKPHLDAWFYEMHTHSREFQQRLREGLIILQGPLAKAAMADVSLLTRDERTTLLEAVGMVERHLYYLSRVETPRSDADTERIYEPVIAFRLMRQQYEGDDSLEGEHGRKS